MTAPGKYDRFASFGEAAEGILRLMLELLPLDLWLVARIHDDEWTVLHAVGDGAFAAGDVLPLKATICNALLQGGGPNVAPDVSAVPAYARAPLGRVHAVGSYAGAPLVVNAAPYGMLCGMSTAPAPAALVQQTPHLITAARTLSTILGQQLHAEALIRRVERAENEALVDELTGLYNRRGWEELVQHEQARGRRYGHQHAVFFMDIDGLKVINDEQGHEAGDEAIVRTADAIISVTREHDVAARVGGDEFALLALETPESEAAALAERLAAAFRAAGVAVSIGYARAEALPDVATATRKADAEMYHRKSDRAATGERRRA